MRLEFLNPFKYSVAAEGAISRRWNSERMSRESTNGHRANAVRHSVDIAVRLLLQYLNEMRQDMRYAMRALVKSPGFALVGIVSLGIGIGATTYVYSSKFELLFRELPGAANAKRLVIPEKLFSYYYIEQFREQKNLLTGVSAFQTNVPFNVDFQGDVNAKPQRVFGQLVSPDYFVVLGVQAQRGRLLSPELDKPGDAPMVVISDRFWRNRLNSSPDAVGKRIRLNGQPATIAGITPKNFNGALSINPAELFVPITAPAALAPELANDVLHQRTAKEFLALICMAPGVSIESAEAALDTITRRLDDEEDHSASVRADQSRRVTLLLAGTVAPLPRDIKPVLLGFFIALMGLIVTIACMNLANMLLARGATRRKELAIRLAIGASRFRLIRQMMNEGILLSLLGGLAGFALAYGLSLLNSKFRQPTAVPVETGFTVDWHLAIFVFVLAIGCGLGFSLVPAIRATKADVTPALKEGSVLPLLGYRRFGLRNLLIVAQVAGSLMLLLITGFLIVGVSRRSSVQTKFDPRTMYLLSIDPVRQGYTPEKARALFERLPEQLRTIPAVGSVVLAVQTPYSNEDEDTSTQLTAEDLRGTSRVQISALKETVGPGYFAALSEPMLAGREFVELDQKSQADGSKALPAVLNESAAHGLFGNGNAIGARFRDDKQSYEVVGVVHNRSNGLGISRSMVYLPLTQRDFVRSSASGITVIVRSISGVGALSGIRQEIASIDPNLDIFSVQTLNDYLELSRYYTRFAVSTYGGIGLFGLVLAAIGLAGVTAYAVERRRKEIGIRIALGARKGQVLLLVLREGMALVITGTALGFLGATVMAQLLSAVTNIFAESFKVGTKEPLLLVGAPLLLAGLALLACYVPARRSVTIDPVKSLREG